MDGEDRTRGERQEALKEKEPEREWMLMSSLQTFFWILVKKTRSVITNIFEGERTVSSSSSSTLITQEQDS